MSGLVTRVFQTKAIHRTLWNACYYVLKFNYPLLQKAGAQNTSRDFLPRIGINSKERVEFKLREDKTLQTIHANLQSSDVAGEEQLFFLPKETLQREEDNLL